MKFRFLTKIPQHRTFDYKPRYYDKEVAEFHDKVLEKTSGERAKIKFSRLEFDKKINFKRSREDKVAERAGRYISLAFILIIIAAVVYYGFVALEIGIVIFAIALIWRLQLLQLIANRFTSQE
jgi:hypothetical protein